ncbi:hypothetical protein LTR70_010630 [Exophiala xenobiotica]|uniref:Uncharacterized protein n=1 Tax=Lithohypha guttulata TaxID=1690604 RepID=A0ABR0JTQ7_9EURO|nr:hypothetical protein LTR24_010468 [Lithohypha guttulata]KAK5309069.1 hypothetical protein LTR70_010630 [Exophiala xenobiotica]
MTLQLMLPERRLHERLLTTRIKHLSLNTPQRRWSGSLPPLTRLRTLQIALHGRSASTHRSSWPLVDLSLLTDLEQLHIQGDVWSRVQETFTGVSHIIRCCLLRGPLVVGTRSDDFFRRIATGLQSLFCHGTHVVGQLSTKFPQLAFLAFHQTVQRPGVFLCPHATVRAISIEADDSYGCGRVEDLNTLLQLVLDHTRPTLELLALRSGLSCALAAETLHRFSLVQHMTAVVFDGAIVTDQPLRTTGTGRLTPPRITVTIASWLPNGGRTPPSPSNSIRHLTQLNTADGQIVPPQRCQCGHWDRKLAFDHVGVDQKVRKLPSDLVQIGCYVGGNAPRTAQAVSVPGLHPELKAKEALTILFDIIIFLRGHNSLLIWWEVFALFVHLVIVGDFRLTNATSHAYSASQVTSPQVIRVCYVLRANGADVE